MYGHPVREVLGQKGCSGPPVPTEKSYPSLNLARELFRRSPTISSKVNSTLKAKE